MEYFYQEHARLAIFFENPNKMAVLIVSLTLASLFFLKKSRIWKFFSVCCFVLGCICMTETYSRGAIVSFLICFPIILRAIRLAFGRMWICFFLICLSFVIYLCIHLVGERFLDGLRLCDTSVTNRITLWSSIPNMVFDAPEGWGIGNSGNAYMQWYQALGERLHYRTMVNSHATIFVEVSWLWRFAYFSFWFFAFCFSFPMKRDFYGYVRFCIILSFFVSAFFSSVLENLVLWIVPGIALTASLYANRRRFLSLIFLIGNGTLAIALFSLLIVVLAALKKDSTIRYENGCISVGKNKSQTYLIMLDTSTFGKFYGKAVREIVNERISFHVLDDLSNASSKVTYEKVFLSATRLPSKKIMPKIKLKKLVLVNPSDNLDFLGDIWSPSKVYVIKGEFENDIVLPRTLKYTIVIINGSKKYISMKNIIDI